MIERIVNFIYWSVFAVVCVFEVSVCACLLLVLLIPSTVLMLLFVLIWCIFHPIFEFFRWLSGHSENK